MNEIHHHALKLLRQKDHTRSQLARKLEARFGEVPEGVLNELSARRFIDDRRYAANFVARHPESHRDGIQRDLEEAGVAPETVAEALAGVDWPSLREVLAARMKLWRLRTPLERRDAARLFRALSRLGYPEEEIRDELEQLS